MAHFFTSPVINAKQDKEIIPSTAQKLPEIEDDYAAYLEEDKALNTAYKALSKTLDKNSLPFLIKTQRRWIEWRDSRCEKAQVESGCTGVTTNSQCVGRAHDECILDLTAQRTAELRNFIENPSDASKTHFDFSLKYRYMDEE